MASLPAIDIKVFKRRVRGGTVLEARAFAPDGRPMPVTKRCLIREHVEGDFLRAHGPWGMSEVIHSLKRLCERAALTLLGVPSSEVFTIS